MCMFVSCRGDEDHTSNRLLYHVMTVLKSNVTSRVFEIVVDLTQATPFNEPDVTKPMFTYLGDQGVFISAVESYVDTFVGTQYSI